MTTVLTYNFAEGPDHYKAMELWDLAKQLVPFKTSRGDKIIFLVNKGVMTVAEGNLVLAWLNTFQIEDFAQ